MQKILIATGIFPPEIGGPASYSKVLAEKISGQFYVTVITYSAIFNCTKDKKLPYKVVRIWKRTPWLLRHFLFFCKIIRLARKSDVIFSLNAVSSGIPAILAARIWHKKFFVKIVGDYAWEMAVNKQRTSLLIGDFQNSAKKGKIRLLHALQSWTCRKADGIIVPSEFLKKVVKGWGILPDKIRLIYNEVDFKKSNLSQEEARKKIGIPGNIITSIGRLVPWKGFRLLVKVMPELLKISQFFRLVIIGDGPDKKLLESMVKNINLDKKVYILGRKSQEEIAIYLAASDMFVLNTGYEGFSHQILEVMTAGVPVITTSVGGNKEIVHQGENGFMIRYNDEFNLVEAIKTLWQDTKLRQRFIEGGEKTAKLFNVDSMYGETIKFLTS